MRRPQSFVALEDLGRVRLSRHFTMRDFLHSEIGNFHGRPNIPDDPSLAIAAGRHLAEDLLEPLVETFGPIDVRSGYRSSALNHFGATAVRPQKCAANERSFANHIWDRRDGAGRLGACASIVIPWFAPQYAAGRDWRDLAWWLFDHLPMHAAQFFPRNAAFNLTWREDPEGRIDSYIPPKGTLHRHGQPPEPGRARRYADFPQFRGIAYPPMPEA
ncbi:hypothetical protein [Tropicimonas sp. IMCC34043]|uniref:hypothetical protein n=1 Tax=Tropicimonas sp. IMCC34043 TaxID=2248760 RepID=UPI0018E50D6E|nr:hypothetical protein [Tropicimonas sp. IMCC34043]